MSAQYSRPDGAVMCSSTAISGQDATSDASPADHEETATSCLATCASSCASTARSSDRVSSRSSPSVQHTAADLALYPTVRMFGCVAGDTNSRGTGRCAEKASSLTIRYRSGRSTSLTGRARRAASTVPFRMEVNDPAEGDEQRADGRGTDEPEPERGARQQRRAQRDGEQRRAQPVAAHRDPLPT